MIYINLSSNKNFNLNKIKIHNLILFIIIYSKNFEKNLKKNN